MAKERKPKAGGGSKRKRKKKLASAKWKKYTIQGDSIKRQSNCPRCGPGVFLAKHKGRLYCGKCHYTEFIKEV